MTCKDGRFNTGNKLCSNDLRDLNDNSIIVDGYVNSQELYVEDRLGVERLTLAGIQNKSDKQYDDIQERADAQNTAITDRADSTISKFEGEIDAIIKDAGGVEVVGEFGDSVEDVISQKKISEHLGQDSEGNTVIKDGSNQYRVKYSGTVLDYGAVANGVDIEDEAIDRMLEDVGYLRIPYSYTLRTSYTSISAPVYGDGKIILERGTHRPINGRSINPSRASNNTVFGFGSEVKGINNLVLGQTCGTNIGSESKLNTFIGNNIASGDFIKPSENKPQTGEGNVGIGHHALKKLQNGNYNIGIGTDSLNENKTGHYNIALGMASLQQHVVGVNNIGIGAASLARLEEGNNNTFVGRDSGRELAISKNSIAIGESALRGVSPPQVKFTGDGVKTSYDTGYKGYDSFRVDIDGVNILPREYTSSDGVVTFKIPPSTGSSIVITLTKGLGSSENSIVIGVKSCFKAKDVRNSIVIGYNAGSDLDSVSDKIIIDNGHKGKRFLEADFYGGDDARNRVFIDSSIHPTSDKIRNLGRSSNVFNNLYLLNNPIVTSDAKAKFDIEDIDEKYMRVMSRLKFKQFKLKAGASGRTHFGIVAQEWIAACESEGVDPKESGILVGDEKTGYAIRYNELQILFNAYVMQKISMLQ